MITTTDSSRITTNDYVDQSGCSLNLQYWRLSKLQLCSKIRFTKLWVLLLFIKELFSSSRQSTHNFSNLFHQHQVLLFHFYHIPILFHFLIHLCLLLSRVLKLKLCYQISLHWHKMNLDFVWKFEIRILLEERICYICFIKLNCKYAWANIDRFISERA